MPKRKSLRQEGYRNSLTPNPSPKGRGVIRLEGIEKASPPSPLQKRGE